MTLKTALLWAGVAAIPAWYIYRTITVSTGSRDLSGTRFS